MGKPDYDPNTFWDQRYETHGHTGYKDQLVYCYDQPLRLKAVNEALSNSGIFLNKFSQMLDLGCGVGDFIDKFAKNDVKVTGIDISADVVKKCHERFRDFPNVTVCNSKIEEMSFPNDSFDVVISVTVLQHIVDSDAFSKAIRNVVGVTKIGGHILVFESSPIRIKPNEMTPEYISLKTRREWINAFTQNGCSLIHELCMSQIGLRALSSYDKALTSFFAKKNKGSKNSPNVNGQTVAKRKKQTLPNRMNYFIRRIILAVLKPLDLLFLRVPFPKNRTNLRILVFKKDAVPEINAQHLIFT